MTSADFEKAAKNLIIKKMKDEFGTDINFSELHIVFLTYTLGNLKATLFAPTVPGFYFEITFDRFNDKMYLDIYQKVSNSVHEPEEFDYSDRSGKLSGVTYKANLV